MSLRGLNVTGKLSSDKELCVAATFYESFYRCENYKYGTLKVLKMAIKAWAWEVSVAAKELYPRSIEFFSHHPDAVSMIIFPPNPIINMSDHHSHRQDDLKKIAPKNS